ncbi:MAG TPA: hypothetical protein VHG69_06975 [Thermoleophilaceae bacterium]|nr:hypothetical protein [Thermoleophilaceae bacterium]
MTGREPDEDRERGDADLEISASYTAKSIRFKEKRGVRTRIEAVGDVNVDDVGEGEREGLPDDPEMGKTYRDVKGGKRIAARIRRPDGSG